AAVHAGHLAALRQRALRHIRHRGLQAGNRIDAGVQRIDLVLLNVSRQAHQVVLQLTDRDLALTVADDDVVDRGTASDAGDLLPLAGDHLLHAVRVTLTDQDDARGSDDAVDGIQVRVLRDARLDDPLHAHAVAQVVQGPGGSAGLALDLLVDTLLQAA